MPPVIFQTRGWEGYCEDQGVDKSPHYALPQCSRRAALLKFLQQVWLLPRGFTRRVGPKCLVSHVKERSGRARVEGHWKGHVWYIKYPHVEL